MSLLSFAERKKNVLGSHVRLSKEKLRAEYLPDGTGNGSTCSYVRVVVNGRLAGHVFACRWKYNNKTICWVTQLVVHHDYRERGLATGLLNLLRNSSSDDHDGDDDTIYGIYELSSRCLLSCYQSIWK